MKIEDKALCQDGQIRTVYHEPKPDSWFAVRAWTLIQGRYVTGFVFTITEGDLPKSMIPASGLQFIADGRFNMPSTLNSTIAMMLHGQVPARWSKWLWDF